MLAAALRLGLSCLLSTVDSQLIPCFSPQSRRSLTLHIQKHADRLDKITGWLNIRPRYGMDPHLWIYVTAT